MATENVERRVAIAWYPGGNPKITLVLRVVRTRFVGCRTHAGCDCDPWLWCCTESQHWPGTDADWIEYVPPPFPKPPGHRSPWL